MNNRNRKNRSIFEKKGFYAALYSCIGVVLVLAAFITYNSMDRGSTDTLNINNRQNEAPGTRAPATPRTAFDDDFIVNGINVEEGSIRDILPSLPRQSPPPVEETPAPPAESPPPAEATIIPVQEAVPVMQPLDIAITRQGEDEDTQQDSDEPQEQVRIVNWDDDPIASYDRIIADPVFNIFTGNEDMGWPIRGEVVMGFSMDSLIHDVTLNQFRTNDKISIGANIGTQVRAASDGVVRSIENDRRLGKTVVIEHGNGWFTTYSQLQEHLLVEVGDVVTKDQVIGGVGEPSIFYTLLGSHLSFKVTRDDTSINPLTVLGN